MESHSSTIAMFISEIPVRCSREKTLHWIRDLNHRTTVQDVIRSVLPDGDLKSYSLYLCIGRHRYVLNEASRIYKIVASLNEQKCTRRLLFEIRPSKKRVRFADEIIIQDINGRTITNEKSACHMIETISMPIEKRLEKLKENFQKCVQEKQENYMKLSKRSTLSVINKNVSVQTAIVKQISRSSSESGISSSSSNEDLIGEQRFETLV